MAVGREVAISEVVAGQALVTRGAFKNRERKVGKPIHVDLVGS